MRTMVFGLAALAEMVIAGVLLFLAQSLPNADDVQSSFGDAYQVTNHAAKEVHQVRDQLRLLRQPLLKKHVDEIETNLKTIADNLRDQQIDFDTVKATHDALDNIVVGLDEVAASLDPKSMEDLGKALAVTADFLSKDVIPAAKESANKLERSTAMLEKEAKAIGEFLKATPPNLSALPEFYAGLKQLENGLNKTTATLDLQRLKTMREGFAGMHSALDTGAEQVGKLADFTYPVVTVDGFQIDVENRRFWPKGQTIAAGLRQAGKGVKAADDQLGEMVEGLPELLDSIKATQKVLRSTREALGVTIEKQKSIEPVLKELPMFATQFANELPGLSKNLVMLLRQTEELGKAAEGLRSARNSLQRTSTNWPKIQKALTGSANLLRTTQSQLKKVIANEEEYRSAQNQLVSLSDQSAVLIPMLFQQTVRQLEEQEKSLDQLGHSIEKVGVMIPKYGKSTAQVVMTGRLLAWLVAIVIVCHALYVLAGLRLSQRDSIK